MGMRKKVFTYVTQRVRGATYLLVFESLDEPGFEVPKGSVEPGESLDNAVRREVFEESGVIDLHIITELGTAEWEDEEQHFFHAEVYSVDFGEFLHRVTGNDVDEGFYYKYWWLEIDTDLKKRLVQGCDQFFDELILSVDV